jgi:hypothetical protein
MLFVPIALVRTADIKQAGFDSLAGFGQAGRWRASRRRSAAKRRTSGAAASNPSGRTNSKMPDTGERSQQVNPVMHTSCRSGGGTVSIRGVESFGTTFSAY